MATSQETTLQVNDKSIWEDTRVIDNNHRGEDYTIFILNPRISYRRSVFSIQFGTDCNLQGCIVLLAGA